MQVDTRLANPFIEDPQDWNEELAIKWAREEGVNELTDRHWKVLHELRRHYLPEKNLPVMKVVCHDLGLEEGCISKLFINPEVAWRIAGLPDPGEEAKAYLQTSEVTHKSKVDGNLNG